MTIENQDIEQNSDVDDIVQDDARSEEAENDDDDEVTEITFNGDPLDDDFDDVETNDDDELLNDLNSVANDHTENETPLVNTLRKASRQKDKHIKRLKFNLEQTKKQSTPPPAMQVLQEPVLPKISDYDYDDDDFNNAIKKYSDDLVQYKIGQKQSTENIINLQKAYIKQKSNLNISNFDNYEKIITNNLDIPKQNLILKTDSPALIVLALAKNPELLNELSGLNNEDFAYKIAKIEQKIEVNAVKKPKTKPESKTMIKGSSAPMDDKKTEDRLLEKARQTKNYTEYYAFKKGKK